MDHVMVHPDMPPVRIGEGPYVSTRSFNAAGRISVNGEAVWIDCPYPNPVDIPTTPYEAYALSDWSPDSFAIRLKGNG